MTKDAWRIFDQAVSYAIQQCYWDTLFQIQDVLDNQREVYNLVYDELQDQSNDNR